MIRNLLSYECAFIDIIICQKQGGRAQRGKREREIERHRETERKTDTKTISHKMRQNEHGRE